MIFGNHTCIVPAKHIIDARQIPKVYNEATRLQLKDYHRDQTHTDCRSRKADSITGTTIEVAAVVYVWWLNDDCQELGCTRRRDVYETTTRGDTSNMTEYGKGKKDREE